MLFRFLSFNSSCIFIFYIPPLQFFYNIFYYCFLLLQLLYIKLCILFFLCIKTFSEQVFIFLMYNFMYLSCKYYSIILLILFLYVNIFHLKFLLHFIFYLNGPPLYQTFFYKGHQSAQVPTPQTKDTKPEPN